MLRVRAAAFASAMTIAALLFCLLLQRIPVAPTSYGGHVEGVVSITMVARERATPPSPPQDVWIASSSAQSIRIAPSPPAEAVLMSEGEGALLWLHGAAGKVYFANVQDYRRCLEASISGLSIEGCPAPPPGRALSDYRQSSAQYTELAPEWR